MSDYSRRAFIAGGAAAATGAAIAAAPKIVSSISSEHGTGNEPAAEPTEPSLPAPREPVMAYVRDESTGEVTIVAGAQETTYRDLALVKRLVDAAPQRDQGLEGSIDVITP